MSPGEWIAFAAAAEAPVGAALVWLWRVHEKANRAWEKAVTIERERAADKPAFEARLRVVEHTSLDVRAVASAVKHLGEMTTERLDHMEQRREDHDGWVRENITQLREAINRQG